MTVSLANTSVYSDFSGLTELKARASAGRPEALQEAARQFEALFIQMMLKSMRSAAPGDALLGSDQQALYRDLYDKQMSLHLAERNGLGLAEIIVRQLSQGQDDPHADAELAALSRAPERESLRALPPSPAPSAPTQFSSPTDFVRLVWPHAQRAGRELGVDPRALVAQAALETGWGRAVLQHADGRSAHNLFGIKADARWDGERVARQTLEYRDGVMVRERAAFRAYPSVAASFDDYVRFIQGNPRYAPALAASQDATQWSRELQRAGYASDPDYAKKINKIMRSEVFYEALAELKISAADPIS